MKRLLLILFLLNSITFSFGQKTGSIKGTVVDKTSGDPLSGANVILENTSLGKATDIDGNFLLENIPVGKHILATTYIGYKKHTDTITVTKSQSLLLKIEMEYQVIEGEEVVVTGQAKGHLQAINQQLSSSTITNIVSSEKLKELPDANAAESIGRLPGVSTQSSSGQTNNVVLRGLTSSNNSVNVNGVQLSNSQPDIKDEEYGKITENNFKSVLSSPLSTFSLDVDNASYSNVRRFIMRNQMPYKDAIRTEEMINYFDYNYEEPDGDHPLKANIEYGDCPWNKDTKLIQIGIKAKNFNSNKKVRQNLVFLIDVSGSMDSPDKLPLLKKSFKLLVDQLDENDKISIVVYAGSAGMALPPTNGDKKGKILSVLESLQARGSTAGGAGIQLAYETAAENFIDRGNNRIILATDGDFNVGISNTSDLVDFVSKKKDEGIFITVLGFGTGNYKDEKMQEIADRGNGNHAYIDNIMEAKKVLVNELNSTLFTIAKDVKIQIEFNPAKVKEYRLIGYENRLLNDEDFVDDTKDAGEVGYGHTVTALYEIKPGKAESSLKYSELKYQEYRMRDGASESDEILTVKFRYKRPDENRSIEFSEILTDDPEKFEYASDNFRFASSVAEFAMLLRDSKFKGTSNYDEVESIAKKAKGEDKYGYRAEFIQLVERVKLIKQTEE